MSKVITDEQKEQIIELSKQGLTNKVMAYKLHVKVPTICYWKKELRKQGFDFPSAIGRPKLIRPFKQKGSIGTLEE